MLYNRTLTGVLCFLCVQPQPDQRITPLCSSYIRHYTYIYIFFIYVYTHTHTYKCVYINNRILIRFLILYKFLDGSPSLQ